MCRTEWPLQLQSGRLASLSLRCPLSRARSLDLEEKHHCTRAPAVTLGVSKSQSSTSVQNKSRGEGRVGLR